MAWDPWEDVAGRDNVTLTFYPAHIGGPIQAMYFPGLSLIAIASGLPDSVGRSLLAEELAHHDLGHQPIDDPVETARMELRAQRWAAHALIDLDQLAEVCRCTDAIEDIAVELDVDEHLLRVRLDSLDHRAAALDDTDEWYL